MWQACQPPGRSRCQQAKWVINSDLCGSASPQNLAISDAHSSFVSLWNMINMNDAGKALLGARDTLSLSLFLFLTVLQWRTPTTGFTDARMTQSIKLSSRMWPLLSKITFVISRGIRIMFRPSSFPLLNGVKGLALELCSNYFPFPCLMGSEVSLWWMGSTYFLLLSVVW